MQEIFKMLPYLVTIIVLIITSLRKKKEQQPPESLGLAYFRRTVKHRNGGIENMRKHIAVIIALVMAFSLCGCGSSKSLFPENTGNKQQTKTADSGSIKVGYLLSSDGDAPDTVARVQESVKCRKRQVLPMTRLLLQKV